MAVLMSERVNEVDKTSVFVCECEHVKECVSLSLGASVSARVCVMKSFLIVETHSYSVRRSLSTKLGISVKL